MLSGADGTGDVGESISGGIGRSRIASKSGLCVEAIEASEEEGVGEAGESNSGISGALLRYSKEAGLLV